MAFPLKLTSAFLVASVAGFWTDWMVCIAIFTALACVLTMRQLRAEVRDLRESAEDAVD
jgi:hypothetical protein